MPGKLIFKLLNVSITRKGDQFLSMSPWAVILFDGQRKTSEPVENGNKEPEFNLEYEFQRNADLKLTIQIFKKEHYYGPLKNPLERDILIGQGIYNTIQNIKKNGRQNIEIDLVYDYDKKLAGKAYAEIEFIKQQNIEKIKNDVQQKEIKRINKGHVEIQNIQIQCQQMQDLQYYLKVRSGTQIEKTQYLEANQGQINLKDETYNMYIRNQKLIYFDIQEVMQDDKREEILQDDLLGIAILEVEKVKENEGQSQYQIPIKYQGKTIGNISLDAQYISYQNNQQDQSGTKSLILLGNKQSKQDLQRVLEKMQQQSKHWVSPEQMEVELLLKRKQLLDRRKMNMRSQSRLEKANLQASIFSKIHEDFYLEKKDIVLDTIPVKLPYVTTNNHLEVPVQYSKDYIRQIHGTGMSTFESSSSLQMSVPKYSIPEQKRFKDKQEQSPGPASYGGSGIPNDKFSSKKFQKVTALADIRETKIERKPRVPIDTGLKKKQQ